MNDFLRREYPRPQFERDEWMSLNGKWDFSFDAETYDRSINVPFAYEAGLSGIGVSEFHDTIWYRRTFTVPQDWDGRRVMLNFGAVDYTCNVWVNDHHILHHVGGQTGFSADITEALVSGANSLRVRVDDYHKTLDIPRGKQFWKEESASIFYTATMGIWQSVWIEPVGQKHLCRVLITPRLDDKSVCFDFESSGYEQCSLVADISFEGKLVARSSVYLQNTKGQFSVQIDERTLGAWNAVEDFAWTPENPRLFDVVFYLKEYEKTVDTVRSYFGMRKISIENGHFLLNNRPYYQRLILDQGYWPDGLLTAPSDEAFVKDITLAKQMGFNGARKHQKVEDPRYLYYADHMGFLVWGEIGSGYTYSRRLAVELMSEWTDVVLRDYNHPCIVAWTPMNESWGVQEIASSPEQQNFCRALAAMTKALDGTRPVSDNDGWEHVNGDLLTVHDYEANDSVLRKRYSSLERILTDLPAGRAMYAGTDADYREEPIIVSEFGGISFAPEGAEGWGYSMANSENDFLDRYRAVVSPLLQSPHVRGFCYTQLTDVEQEINGLLTYDRKPKADINAIRQITLGEPLSD